MKILNKIEETIDDLIFCLEEGEYIDACNIVKFTEDVTDLITLNKEMLEIIKHYADSNTWTRSNLTHVDDWYSLNNVNGYDIARNFLNKLEKN